MSLTLAALSLASVAIAQKAGTTQPETHLPLNWQTCTASGCTPVEAEVVIDANWRWTHCEWKQKDKGEKGNPLADSEE